MIKKIILLMFLITACKYQADLQFMSDSQANAFTEQIYINGLLCKDIDNQIGVCSLQISDTQRLNIKIDERPYSYRLSVVCSTGQQFELVRDIDKLEKHEFEIIPKIKSFTCIGEIIPKDRETSAKFEFRIKVKDSKHIAMDGPRINGDNLIVGQYALHTKVCTASKCEFETKKPIIKIKAPIVSVAVESYKMRKSYYGL